MIVNIVLIYLSGLNKGLVAFISIPFIFLLNLTVSIIGFVKGDRKLGFTAIILFFVTPVLAFIVFAQVFQFLTR